MIVKVFKNIVAITNNCNSILFMQKRKKYFGTDGIRKKVGEFPLTPEFTLKLGWAIGKIFKKNGSSKVLIGKDTRISGYMFESALESGLSSAGMDVILLGPIPTPAIAYLTRASRASLGIVISASHNPYYDNGIKFFSPQGTKLSDELQMKIENFLNKKMTVVDSEKLGKAYRMDDAPGRYIEFCKSSFPKNFDLKGLKIVVDSANGATYHVASKVFSELGAKVISMGNTPDGLNINKKCGSTNPQFLRKKVLKESANLGIAFDGDGDRVFMVDSKGHIIDGDLITYFISLYYIFHKKYKTGVAGTVMTNLAIEDSLKKANIEFVRTKVGDRYISEELQKRNWLIGGEQSGHIICRDHTTTGDGIISALQILAYMKVSNKSLLELFKSIKLYPQVMINVPLGNKKAQVILKNPKVKNSVKQAENMLKNSGRIVLRPSGTEPVIRVMVEAKTKSLAEKTAKIITKSILSLIT